MSSPSRVSTSARDRPGARSYTTRSALAKSGVWIRRMISIATSRSRARRAWRSCPIVNSAPATNVAVAIACRITEVVTRAFYATAGEPLGLRSAHGPVGDRQHPAPAAVALRDVDGPDLHAIQDGGVVQHADRQAPLLALDLVERAHGHAALLAFRLDARDQPRHGEPRQVLAAHDQSADAQAANVGAADPEATDPEPAPGPAHAQADSADPDAGEVAAGSGADPTHQEALGVAADSETHAAQTDPGHVTAHARADRARQQSLSRASGPDSDPAQDDAGEIAARARAQPAQHDAADVASGAGAEAADHQAPHVTAAADPEPTDSDPAQVLLGPDPERADGQALDLIGAGDREAEREAIDDAAHSVAVGSPEREVDAVHLLHAAVAKVEPQALDPPGVADAEDVAPAAVIRLRASDGRREQRPRRHERNAKAYQSIPCRPFEHWSGTYGWGRAFVATVPAPSGDHSQTAVDAPCTVCVNSGRVLFCDRRVRHRRVQAFERHELELGVRDLAIRDLLATQEVLDHRPAGLVLEPGLLVPGVGDHEMGGVRHAPHQLVALARRGVEVERAADDQRAHRGDERGAERVAEVGDGPGLAADQEREVDHVGEPTRA